MLLLRYNSGCRHCCDNTMQEARSDDFTHWPVIHTPLGWKYKSCHSQSRLIYEKKANLSPLNNQTITIMVGGGCKRNYRSVITREEAESPVCFNFSNGAVCLGAGWERKGLLMEIHSELIAGHYTTTGRDQRKELNGRRRRVLVNHHTHTHTHCEADTPLVKTLSMGASTHSPTHISAQVEIEMHTHTQKHTLHTPPMFFFPDYSITVEFV